MQFQQDRTVRERSYGFQNVREEGTSDQREVRNARKVCTTTFLRLTSTSRVVGKLSIREVQMCSFSRIGRKVNKIHLGKIYREKLEIFHSTSGNHPLREGSAIFLQRCYTSRIVVVDLRRWKALN